MSTNNHDLMKALINNKITISEDLAGQRCDNFLFAICKNLPKHRIYKLIRSGELRINSGRFKPSYKLIAGDILRLPPSLVTELNNDRLLEASDTAPTKANNKTNHRPIYLGNTLLQDLILFEDDKLLIINKPTNIAVHGGSGIKLGLIEQLRLADPRLYGRLELVHRLDRDTSGCLVLAKKRSALRTLHEVWRERQADKCYHMLVLGSFREKNQGNKCTVKEQLLRYESSQGERLVKIVPKATPGSERSHTEFTLLEEYYSATLKLNFSLVQAQAITGKTHQLRVHCAHLGLPIIGDAKYGDRVVNQLAKQKLGLARMLLHARNLTVPSLVNKDDVLTICAPYDTDFDNFLAKLKRK